MKALLNIVAGLLLLVQSYKVKKEQEYAQSQANEINKDPTDWFNGHFDGGLHKQSADEAITSEATSSSKEVKH